MAFSILHFLGVIIMALGVGHTAEIVRLKTSKWLIFDLVMIILTIEVFGSESIVLIWAFAVLNWLPILYGWLKNKFYSFLYLIGLIP